MTWYIESIFIGIMAYVYAGILTEPEMIFNKPYVYAKEILPDWIFRPIIGCFYCVAGQLAFWYYIYLSWGYYDVIDHILFITSAIFTTEIISTILNKLNR